MISVDCSFCGKPCDPFPSWGYYDEEHDTEVNMCQDCAKEALKKIELAKKINKCKGCKSCSCGG